MYPENKTSLRTPDTSLKTAAIFRGFDYATRLATAVGILAPMSPATPSFLDAMNSIVTPKSAEAASLEQASKKCILIASAMRVIDRTDVDGVGTEITDLTDYSLGTANAGSFRLINQRNNKEDIYNTSESPYMSVGVVDLTPDCIQEKGAVTYKLSWLKDDDNKKRGEKTIKVVPGTPRVEFGRREEKDLNIIKKILDANAPIMTVGESFIRSQEIINDAIRRIDPAFQFSEAQLKRAMPVEDPKQIRAKLEAYITKQVSQQTPTPDNRTTTPTPRPSETATPTGPTPTRRETSTATVTKTPENTRTVTQTSTITRTPENTATVTRTATPTPWGWRNPETEPDCKELKISEPCSWTFDRAWRALSTFPILGGPLTFIANHLDWTLAIVGAIEGIRVRGIANLRTLNPLTWAWNIWTIGSRALLGFSIGSLPGFIRRYW